MMQPIFGRLKSSHRIQYLLILDEDNQNHNHIHSSPLCITSSSIHGTHLGPGTNRCTWMDYARHTLVANATLIEYLVPFHNILAITPLHNAPYTINHDLRWVGFIQLHLVPWMPGIFQLDPSHYLDVKMLPTVFKMPSKLPCCSPQHNNTMDLWEAIKCLPWRYSSCSLAGAAPIINPQRCCHLSLNSLHKSNHTLLLHPLDYSTFFHWYQQFLQWPEFNLHLTRYVTCFNSGIVQADINSSHKGVAQPPIKLVAMTGLVMQLQLTGIRPNVSPKLRCAPVTPCLKSDSIWLKNYSWPWMFGFIYLTWPLPLFSQAGSSTLQFESAKFSTVQQSGPCIVMSFGTTQFTSLLQSLTYKRRALRLPHSHFLSHAPSSHPLITLLQFFMKEGTRIQLYVLTHASNTSSVTSNPTLAPQIWLQLMFSPKWHSLQRPSPIWKGCCWQTISFQMAFMASCSASFTYMSWRSRLAIWKLRVVYQAEISLFQSI